MTEYATGKMGGTITRQILVKHQRAAIPYQPRPYRPRAPFSCVEQDSFNTDFVPKEYFQTTHMTDLRSDDVSPITKTWPLQYGLIKRGTISSLYIPDYAGHAIWPPLINSWRHTRVAGGNGDGLGAHPDDLTMNNPITQSKRKAPRLVSSEIHSHVFFPCIFICFSFHSVPRPHHLQRNEY